MELAAKFGIVVLIALAFTALPGGGGTLNTIQIALQVLFFTLLGYWGYRLYRQYRFELESLSEQQRFVLYSSVGLAFVVLCSTGRLFTGLGILVWLALLGVCSYGVYWVWTQYQRMA